NGWSLVGARRVSTWAGCAGSGAATFDEDGGPLVRASVGGSAARPHPTRTRLRPAFTSAAKAGLSHLRPADPKLLSKEFTHPPRQSRIRTHPLDGQRQFSPLDVTAQCFKIRFLVRHDHQANGPHLVSRFLSPFHTDGRIGRIMWILGGVVPM